MEANSPMTKQRIESFSDGVFSVAITLLVLDLRVPTIQSGSSFHGYLVAMSPLYPRIFSMLLSFILVAIYWINHHFFFQFIERGTSALIWINNLLLLFICLVPFATSVLGQHPTDTFPVVLYGTNLLLVALSFYALRYYSYHAHILKATSEQMQLLNSRQSFPAIALNSLGILLAFVNVYLSFLCFLIFLVLYFMPSTLHHLRPSFQKQK